jgi:hypothetical protein
MYLLNVALACGGGGFDAASRRLQQQQQQGRSGNKQLQHERARGGSAFVAADYSGAIRGGGS